MLGNTEPLLAVFFGLQKESTSIEMFQKIFTSYEHKGLGNFQESTTKSLYVCGRQVVVYDVYDFSATFLGTIYRYHRSRVPLSSRRAASRIAAAISRSHVSTILLGRGICPWCVKFMEIAFSHYVRGTKIHIFMAWNVLSSFGFCCGTSVSYIFYFLAKRRCIKLNTWLMAKFVLVLLM